MRWILPGASTVLAALCIATISAANAQNTNSGDIRGTVTDTSGAVIPGATVTVTYVRGARSASYTQHVNATFPNGVAYAADGWLSYDPSAKRWVYIETGNIGDYTVATSPGWHENVMVMTDVLMTGGDTGGTTTFKKLNDTTVDAASVQSSGTLSQHCVKK